MVAEWGGGAEVQVCEADSQLLELREYRVYRECDVVVEDFEGWLTSKKHSMWEWASKEWR